MLILTQLKEKEYESTDYVLTVVIFNTNCLNVLNAVPARGLVTRMFNYRSVTFIPITFHTLPLLQTS